VPFGVVAGSGSAEGAGLGDAAPGEEKGAEDTIGDGEASEDAAGVGDGEGDGDGVGDRVGVGVVDGAGDGKASGDGLGDGKACGAGAWDGKASGDGDALVVLAGVMAGDAAAAGEAADEPTATMRTLSLQSDSKCTMVHPDAAAKMKVLC